MDEEATATGRNHGEQPLDELSKEESSSNPDRKAMEDAQYLSLIHI